METITPEFESPYPDGWSSITDFKYDTPLVLFRGIEAVKMRGGKEDADYIVGADYKVEFLLDEEPTSITVPKGMLTDLASVPSVARSIVGRVGPHLEASIVHDFLYIAWQDLADHGARKADRRFADELFRVAMKEAKVRWMKRTLILLAVKSVGWLVYKKRNPPPRYVSVP